MSAELELVARRTTTVGAHEWDLISRQASALSQSDIIPSAYRRRPANIIAAALTGRQHGWDVMTAMRNGHVIEGTWAMRPEAMLGLVRQAGHSVTADIGTDRATVTGKRGDTGDEMSFTFTLDDAVRANLVTLRDGRPYARSSTGKPLPWEQYPQMMCYWRAVGMLCRMLFSDVTLGVYTAEEMGAQVDQDGNVIDVDEITYGPQPLSEAVLQQFHAACDVENVAPAEVMLAAFGDAIPDPLTDEHLPKMRDAFKKLVEDRGALESAGAAAPAPEGRPATKAQVGKIKGEYKRIGIEDRELQLDRTTEYVGRAVESHNELTTDEAAALIEAMIGWAPVEQPEVEGEVIDGG